MYRIAKIILFSVLGVLSAFYIAVLSFGFFMGTHTQYCPWQHIAWDTGVCLVLDQTDDRILIQHADLSANIYYLEIKSNKISKYYESPIVAQIGPGDYLAKLVPSNKEYILINNEKFHLVEIKNDGT